MVDFENTQPDSLDDLHVGSFKIKVFIGPTQVKGRIATKFAMSMQRHGEHAEYVEIEQKGKNAADLRIALLLGQLMEREPDAAFFIVSNDRRDFDPLVATARKNDSKCLRVKSIAEIVKQRAPVRTAQQPKQNSAPVARQPAPQPQKQTSSRAKPSAPAKQAQAKAPQPAAKPAPPPVKPAPGVAAARPSAGGIDVIVKHLRSLTGKPGTRKKLAQTIGAYFKHHGGPRSEKEIEQTIEELVRLQLVKQDGTKISYALG